MVVLLQSFQTLLCVTLVLVSLTCYFLHHFVQPSFFRKAEKQVDLDRKDVESCMHQGHERWMVSPRMLLGEGKKKYAHSWSCSYCAKETNCKEFPDLEFERCDDCDIDVCEDCMRQLAGEGYDCEEADNEKVVMGRLCPLTGQMITGAGVGNHDPGFGSKVGKSL